MKPTQSRSFRIKLAERVIWTAIQAGLGLITVEVFDLPGVYAPLIATALATLKGYVASKVGDPYEPATLPAGV